MESTIGPADRMLAFLNRMIEAMSEAVLVIDGSGLVVAANDAAATLLDFPGKATALRPLDEYSDLIHGWSVGDEPFAPERLRESLLGRTLPNQVATITTAAGVEHVIKFTCTPIHDDQGQVMMAMFIASDVTDAERTLAYWRTVGAAALGVSTELVVERVIETVLDQIVALFGAQAVIGVWKFHEDSQKLVLMSSRGLSDENAARLQLLSLDDPCSVCEAARACRTIHAEDARARPPSSELDRHLVDEEHLSSWVASPLLAGGRLIGVMSYGLRSPHRFYEGDLEAITVVGGLFGVAIDHAQLYEESQGRGRQLEQATEEIRDINQQLLIAGVQEQELAEVAEQSRVELRALLETTTEGVTIFDGKGEITFLNETGKQFWGVPPEEWLPDSYRRLDIRYPDGHPIPFGESPMARALRGERFANCDVVYVRHDGRKLMLNFSGSAIRDAQGHVRMAINMYRDVTAAKEAEEELERLLASEREARTLTESAVRARDEFLSIASHELKTPLTSLLGYSQVLNRQIGKGGSADPERLRVVLGTIAKQSMKLANLVNHLLDVSRIEGGKLTLDRQTADISSIVQAAVADAHTKGSQHEIVVHSNCQVEACVDALRLEQVLINLLDNAIKFSPDGTVIDLEVATLDGRAVRIVVRDQGIGIPPEQRAELFSRFYQAHQSGYSGGLGLGLFISKQIVELHGGTIEAEFPEEGGTRFVVTLPTSLDGEVV